MLLARVARGSSALVRGRLPAPRLPGCLARGCTAVTPPPPSHGTEHARTWC